MLRSWLINIISCIDKRTSQVGLKLLAQLLSEFYRNLRRNSHSIWNFTIYNYKLIKEKQKFARQDFWFSFGGININALQNSVIIWITTVECSKNTWIHVSRFIRNVSNLRVWLHVRLVYFVSTWLLASLITFLVTSVNSIKLVVKIIALLLKQIKKKAYRQSYSICGSWVFFKYSSQDSRQACKKLSL